MNATGEYTLIADVDKPTANSFYSADHGLADGESVVYSTLAGGTTPTADTGRLDINSAINAGNTAVAWTVLSNSLTTWLEGNLPGHRDLLMDGPDARNPIRSGVASGTTSCISVLSMVIDCYRSSILARSTLRFLLCKRTLSVTSFTPNPPNVAAVKKRVTSGKLFLVHNVR